MSRYYGIDLHLESINVAVLDDTQNKPVYLKIGLYTEAFTQFITQLKDDDYLAVEASTNTFWFIDQVKEHIGEYFVLNPFKFSIISNSSKKTDKVDALKIATKLKYYVCFDKSEDEFPTVFVPPKEVQELRSLFSTYESIKKQAMMTKNRIRSLLRQNGIIEFKGTNLSYLIIQEKLLQSMPSGTLSTQMYMLVELLRTQEMLKQQSKDEILKAGQIFHREIELLVSIRGVSPFLAIAFMADTVTVERFKNAKHLCSYLRTAPRINASGNTTHIGAINKSSRSLTISLMTESVKHFIDSSEEMHRFYFKKRKGKNAGKVRVAVMRKMMVTMYKMLKRNEYYYYRDEEKHKIKMRRYDALLKNAS